MMYKLVKLWAEVSGLSFEHKLQGNTDIKISFFKGEHYEYIHIFYKFLYSYILIENNISIL